MNKFYFIVLLLISFITSSQINNTELNSNKFYLLLKIPLIKFQETLFIEIQKSVNELAQNII